VQYTHAPRANMLP